MRRPARPQNPPLRSLDGRNLRLRRVLATLLLGPLLTMMAQAQSAPTPSLEQARELYRQGERRLALQAFREVASNTEDLNTAASARTNACLILNQLSEHASALEECEQALVLRRQQENPLRLSRTLNNLGLVLQALARYDEAQHRFTEALEINRELQLAEAQVINLSNLANGSILAGRYAMALEWLNAAAEIVGGHREEPWAQRQQQFIDVNRGVVLLQVGALREALELNRKVLALPDELGPAERAQVRINLGAVYRNLGDPVRAIEAYRSAEADFAVIGDLSGQANARLNLGLAQHLNLRQLQAAGQSFRHALELARETGDLHEEHEVLFYLGSLQLELGDLQQAEQSFRQVLELAQRIGTAEGTWSAKVGLARLAERSSDPAQGLTWAMQAVEAVEQVRASLPHDALRSGYFGDKRPVYATAVRLLLNQHTGQVSGQQARQALELVQRAKARDLLDRLGGPAPELPPASVEQLQTSVGDAQVVEYFHGEDRLWAWILDQSSVRVVDLGAARPVLDRAMELHAALARGDRPDPSLLTTLARALIEPLALRPSTQLLVAPDGPLWYLPFELLPDSKQDGEPLVQHRVIRYLPSASVMLRLDRPEEKAPVPWTWQGFGSPTLPTIGEHPNAATLLAQRFDLRPLPASSRELATVSSYLAGPLAKAHIGERATKENFLSVAAQGSRVLHLATHAVLDDRPGRGTAILLSPGSSDDGLLYPEEVARLELRNELTVLAACNTALGPETDGRALSSLSGAFLAAGSRAVVATLWAVGDEATAAFMEQFYFQLGKGQSPAQALAKAKRRLLADRRWAHPALWSGYVLVGDGEAVSPARRQLPSWMPWLVGLLVLLLILAWRPNRRQP